MPRASLVDPTDAPPSTGVLLFVDTVRLRREVSNKLDGTMTVDLKMNCDYLEVHFAKPEAGTSTERSGTGAPPGAGKGREPSIAKMAAKGQIDVLQTAKGNETTVKGTLALWRRDPRREWIAEIIGDPYAEWRQDDWKEGKYLKGEKVKLWGYPAEVQVDNVRSIGGVVP